MHGGAQLAAHVAFTNSGGGHQRSAEHLSDDHDGRIVEGLLSRGRHGLHRGHAQSTLGLDERYAGSVEGLYARANIEIGTDEPTEIEIRKCGGQSLRGAGLGPVDITVGAEVLQDHERNAGDQTTDLRLAHDSGERGVLTKTF